MDSQGGGVTNISFQEDASPTLSEANVSVLPHLVGSESANVGMNSQNGSTPASSSLSARGHDIEDANTLKLSTSKSAQEVHDVAAKAIPTDMSTPPGIQPAPYDQFQSMLNGCGTPSNAEVAKNLASTLPPINESHHSQQSMVQQAAEHISNGLFVETVRGCVVSARDIPGTAMTTAAEALEVPLPGASFTEGITAHVSNDPEAASAMIHGADPVLVLEHHISGSNPSSGTKSSGLEQEDVIQTGRIDASNMEVLDNPLSKSDRYTVIKGRLPDSDPYMQAAKKLGLVFMSREMQSSMPDLFADKVTEEERKEYFMRDIEAFNKELNREYKVPIIGGGQLSLYSLALEVMKLGGLKNVVINRAFRIVGQQLELPKSCTSAAFVLKNAYERLLYLYEQKLAFGTTPKYPQRTIDMKSVVSETRKKSETARSRAKKAKLSSSLENGTVQGRVAKKSGIGAKEHTNLDELRNAISQEYQPSSPCGALPPDDTVASADILLPHDVPGLNSNVQSSVPLISADSQDGGIAIFDWAGQSPTHPFIDDFASKLGIAQACNRTATTSPTTVNASKFDVEAEPDHIDVPLKDRRIKTEEEVMYALFGSNDSVRALQMAARILQSLQQSETPIKLSTAQGGAGATLVAAIVQGLANYLDILRSPSQDQGGWRALIARCAGEMLQKLLMEQNNQVFCAMSKNLWLVSTRILQMGTPDDRVVRALWAAVSIMAPYLVSNVQMDALAELLHVASDYLGKSSKGAVEVTWFISGSVRGLTAKMGPEHDELIEQLFVSLVEYNSSGDSALRHATLTALLHLSRVYPETAGKTAGLLYRLIEQLTDATSGGLSASTLYYITQASPETLTGYEDFLVAQTRRVATMNTGPQADQMVAILGLLTSGV